MCLLTGQLNVPIAFVKNRLFELIVFVDWRFLSFKPQTVGIFTLIYK